MQSSPLTVQENIITAALPYREMRTGLEQLIDVTLRRGLCRTRVGARQNVEDVRGGVVGVDPALPVPDAVTLGVDRDPRGQGHQKRKGHKKGLERGPHLSDIELPPLSASL